eukprot:g32421.t1
MRRASRGSSELAAGLPFVRFDLLQQTARRSSPSEAVSVSDPALVRPVPPGRNGALVEQVLVSQQAAATAKAKKMSPGARFAATFSMALVVKVLCMLSLSENPETFRTEPQVGGPGSRLPPGALLCGKSRQES